MLVGVDPVVRDQLAKTGMLEVLGEENVFVATPQLGAALNQAVAAATAGCARRRSMHAPWRRGPCRHTGAATTDADE